MVGGILHDLHLFFSVSHGGVRLVNGHLLSQGVLGASQVVWLLKQLFLVHLLAEEVGGVERAHALDHDFVREHCWRFSATFGAVAFHSGHVEGVSCHWLMQSWAKVALRGNVDQEILPRELVCRAGRLLLSVPELLTFVIDFR